VLGTVIEPAVPGVAAAPAAGEWPPPGEWQPDGARIASGSWSPGRPSCWPSGVPSISATWLPLSVRASRCL